MHSIDGRGKPVFRKQLKRAQMPPFFAKLEPGLAGTEARGGVHYWVRKLAGLGHAVRLTAPQFVKPDVRSSKTDAVDAEASCKGVSRPSMRFVPKKTEDQNAVLALHRVGQEFVRARTAQANQIRGLLSEFGLVLSQGIG